MILARTELATIDALRASGEEPERILELIESIVNKGIDTGRFDMCHVETDPEAALRLAEALLGTNRYPAFARAMRILEAVTPYVEDRSDGMLLFTLSTIARMLCGCPFDAAGRAVSRLFDKVKCKGRIGFIFGRRSFGYFDVRTLDGVRLSAGVSFKKLMLVEKRTTFLTQLRKECGASSPS